jgi:hypothetical protein
MLAKKLTYVALGFALISLASCTKSAQSRGGGVPAKALQSSSTVYADFEKVLDAQRQDSEFAKFAADAENYQVFISEDGRDFMYTFQLKPFHGNSILDGRVTYRVLEDGSVHREGIL